MSLLKVENLNVEFNSNKKITPAIRDVSFTMDKNETIGIAGESGSGKSLSMKAILRVLPPNAYLKSGDIIFNDINLNTYTNKEFRKIQGKDISIIFQDPMSALNPLKTIGYHLDEVLMNHLNLSKSKARLRSIELLDMVEIPNSKERINQYPHQFSGGMRQRVMIALSLACNPQLLIADEPTTALDVTIQLQILKLLKRIQNDNQMSIILITHDLAILYSMCTKIIIMYGGMIMEEGLKDEIFSNPSHPYTKALLASIPKLDSKEKLNPINGIAPSLNNMPIGCPFAPRCSRAIDICHNTIPEKVQLSDTHLVACLNMEDNNE